MADRVERVKIEVSAPGSQEAARSLGTVSGELEGLASGARNTAQRVQGVASSVQTLVGALGSHDRTAGLIASVAGTTAQFSAMGAMLGPAGAVVGAIAGLVTGLASVARASETAGSSINAMGLHAATAEERVRSLNDALATMARNSRLSMAVASMAEYDSEIAGVEARLANLNIAFREMDSSLSGSRSERALVAEIRRESARLEELRGLRSDASTEEADFMMEDLMSSANPDAPTRRRGSRTRPGQEEGFGPQGDTGRPGLATAQSDELERRRALMEERLELVRETSDEELEIELANLEAYGEALAEAAAARKAMEAEAIEKRSEQAQGELEEREALAREMGALFGGTMDALGGAIKQIALGEKTAEDAFKGFAAAFLEMISQYASLKAATEYAEAASSFAKYDFGGGAAHLGAGLAFTAVAVATGIGAAAINQAPAAPARPEAGGEKGAGEGKGGDVIINWNSPVVTAGTKAELGREIGVMLGEAAAI